MDRQPEVDPGQVINDVPVGFVRHSFAGGTRSRLYGFWGHQRDFRTLRTDSIGPIIKFDHMKTSRMAAGLKTSDILVIAGNIRDQIAKGQSIYNLTIGDFDPAIFPIPQALTEEIQRAYEEGHTNYPVSNGMPALRAAISAFTQRVLGLAYAEDDILVSSGGRPIIFSAYLALVDPGDKVIYPAPSWNNNYYCHISGARPIVLHARAEQHFMLSADDIRPHLRGATLLALCSPLNPTGTVFSEAQLTGICEAVLEENQRRPEGAKPLYVLYDQMYGNLLHGATQHITPVSCLPEMRPYTVFVDGISKAFAATGLRLGWGMGPSRLIGRMKSITAHIGAWAGKAEQVGTARFLSQPSEVDRFLKQMQEKVSARLHALYEGFERLKAAGLPVHAIAPQAAIYLSVHLDLHHYQTPEGLPLNTSQAVHAYLLKEAQLALVPFHAFGTNDIPWYRLSIGTLALEAIPDMMDKLEVALKRLVPVAK